MKREAGIYDDMDSEKVKIIPVQRVCEWRKEMKVLQINTVYGSGSVGRICMDLYEICEKNGIESYMAYGRGEVRTDINGYKIGTTRDFVEHVLWNFARGESGFHSNMLTRAFLLYLDELNPDVIHLHNIHGFYINTEMLFDYIKKNNKKVIWTLHDCWPFTGHCAYFDYIACDKWKTGCKNCLIHASSYPYAILCDSTERIYPRKKAAYQGVKNLTIVTPSNWLAGLVKQSFLKEYRVKVIPNGIDLEKFSADAPLPENLAFLGISCNQDEKAKAESGSTSVEETDREEVVPYILGVANVWEHRKGLSVFEHLADDLTKLYKTTKSIPYRIVLVGLSKKQVGKLKKKYPKEVLLGLERTQNIQELAGLYANAAAFVNATLEDNFPTTNLEALACGTPVITFRTGGSGESVDDSCGKVVAKGDYEALVDAIVQTVVTRPFSKEDCVKKAQSYDKKKRFMEYLKLYN